MPTGKNSTPATPTDDARLLEPRPQRVLYELASRNLHTALIDQLVALGPREFQICGEGELTLEPGWVELAQSLLRRGLSLTTITRLNKELSEAEVETFARFGRIVVSCDAQDPGSAQRRRHSGRLERIARNVRRILETCGRDGLLAPQVGLQCTALHADLLGVIELVEWGAQLGVDSFALSRLEDEPAIASQRDPPGALAALRQSREVAERHDMRFEVFPGLEPALIAAAAAVSAATSAVEPVDAAGRSA